MVALLWAHAVRPYNPVTLNLSKGEPRWRTLCGQAEARPQSLALGIPL